MYYNRKERERSIAVELMPFYKHRYKLSCEDGCILCGTRVIVRTVRRSMLMEELHDTQPGISRRIKSLARNYVWWSSMDMDLETKVKRCHSGQVNQHSRAKPPLHPWEYTAIPWSQLHLDFVSPFTGCIFLVIVDSHTNWLKVFQMQNITSLNTAERLRSCFASHGLLDCTMSDNGPTFTSDELCEFTSADGIWHIFAAPHNPSKNGLEERAVQSFKETMKCMHTAPLQLCFTQWLANNRLTTPFNHELFTRYCSMDVSYDDIKNIFCTGCETIL